MNTTSYIVQFISFVACHSRSALTVTVAPGTSNYFLEAVGLRLTERLKDDLVGPELLLAEAQT